MNRLIQTFLTFAENYTMEEIAIDIIGWIGGVAVVIAYLLISAGKVMSSSFLYQMLNLIGSIFLIINTFFKGAYPSTAVNIIWVLIAVYALAKANRDKLRISKAKV
jgi:uncharacterized protein YacL